jgi:hypothetical protein
MKRLRIGNESSGRVATLVRQMDTGQYTVESLADEIQRIVAERQELRGADAPAEVLEENRRALARANSRLSRLLIKRHLPGSEAA